MKKLSKSGELCWVLGTLFVALGVAICSKANLGVSMIAAPAFILQELLSQVWSGFSVGVVDYCFQGVLLILLCLTVQRFNWRYLPAFLAGVIYGYTLDLFNLILESNVFYESVWLQWVMLIVGDACTALGVACFFKTYLPLQVYELFVAEISDRFKLPLSKVKMGFDLSLLLISLTLAFTLFGDISEFSWSGFLNGNFHYIGLGTIVTTAINSPMIDGFSKLLDFVIDPTPAFPKIEKVLKR